MTKNGKRCCFRSCCFHSQESSSTLPSAVETSSKARKRNKNKATAPVPASNANEKNPVTTRAPPATHPKSAAPKDDVDAGKQQGKGQVKSSQVPAKQPSAAPAKKQVEALTTNQSNQKQEEQPFIVVGANRQKAGTSSGQQQTKSVSPGKQ